jgi:hypothetical protein
MVDDYVTIRRMGDDYTTIRRMVMTIQPFAEW